MSTVKTYLGDGVYADYDGRIILTTENGIETTNIIVLEPEVMNALKAFEVRLAKLCGGPSLPTVKINMIG